jgi:hypothetical protein
MNKENFTNFVKAAKQSLAKHSPEILTGLGIAGMITSIVLAVQATPKAVKLIEKEVDRQNTELLEDAEEKGLDYCPQISKLKPIEVVKTTWKCYIPTTVTTVTSVACLVWASSVHGSRNAALAAAYKLSETALAEYKEKVIETIGEKKEQAILDKVYKERVEKNPSSSTEVIITGKGETLCYDYSTGRYFKSDIDKIKKAINELNRRLLSEGYVSLNDFYDELGLKYTSTGNRLGWNTDSGLIDLNYSSALDDDGTPCLVIDYKVPPKYDFDRFF